MANPHRKKANQKNLQKAKDEKNDEFYTLLADIEKEMKYHTEYLKGKVVYCNCDNYKWSNFAKYFMDNFDELQLKRLIVTGYGCDGMIMDAYCIKTFELVGTGSFASPESMAYLKQADVVVTNPPFSLFRNFIALLFMYKKDFLIIGNINAITYKNMFPHIRSGRVSIGINQPKKFYLPDGTIKPVAAVWYTTLPLPNDRPRWAMDKKYSPALHPAYLNYDAINVDRSIDIPCDYYGEVGVPLSYLTKHDPDEFEITGTTAEGFLPDADGGERNVYGRIFIKRRVNGTPPPGAVMSPTASGYAAERQPHLI